MKYQLSKLYVSLYLLIIYIYIYILVFQKRVLRELNIINLKLDDMSEVINIFMKNKNDDLKNSSICNEIPDDIMQLFPVNNNSLAQLEDWLINSEKKYW